MRYPALEVTGAEGDLVLAAVDDWGPLAAESMADGLRIYFPSAEQRAAAARRLADVFPDARTTPCDVDDEDWARRSQAGLGPIVVGRITVRPADSGRSDTATSQAPGAPGSIELAIEPSMGFGTGHHATTRLCLAALQRIEVLGRTVLDVGTGSGVLAFAARALGAREAVGVDNDPDAIQSATANLPLNPRLDGVAFRLADLTREPLSPADVVIANLTGGLLCRHAAALVAAVSPTGTLVLSGLLDSERDAVVEAFDRMRLGWEDREDEWVGLAFDHRGKKV